nr:unnamed protein product [Callosobruchus chinensis]
MNVTTPPLYKRYPDLEAFDQLWHASLLNKLPSYGLPVKLCRLPLWSQDNCRGGRLLLLLSINAGVPQGSALTPILFLLHINDLLSSTTNPIHSFADDSTLHAGIMSHRPISMAIAAWGLRNMVEFNASKNQYCTLSNKRCPSEHSVLMNNQALPRSHSFKLLGVSITENMIWHAHVSSVATDAGKTLLYLFKARKYFSPSNLLTLYKAQVRPSLEYCSHIWGAAAPTTLSILDAVQRRAIRLIGDPALTCHLQPLSHRRAVGVTLASNGKSNADIDNKIAQVKRAICQLNLILWSDKISKKNKKAIYHAIVESITTYGAEIWELNEKERNKIREIIDVQETILDTIGSKCLTWYGHLERMANNRWPKKVWEWTPPGRRKRGRPPRSWKKDVEEEMVLRGLQEGDWWNRDLWRLRSEKRRQL